MRVLHVISSSDRRGAQIFAADLIASLCEHDVSQRVAILRSTDGGGVDFGVRTDLLATGGLRIPGLKMGVEHLRALRRLIQTARPDVIQAHGGEALKYVVPAAAPSRAPIVYRRIGGTPAWIRRGPARVVYGGLMRRPARVVAVAEAVRRETIDTFRVPPTRVITIPNAVDVRRSMPGRTRVQVRDELDLSPDAPVIVSVGALTWEKDPLALVDVCARVLREMPTATYLMVGAGPMRKEVEALVARSGLTNRVRMLGQRSDVPDILCSSDVLVFASRPDGMEGMPGILIEAGLASLPVAAYSIAGVSEVVADGVTGALVDWGDRAGLAGHLSSLLSDRGLRERMGAAARARCLQRFDIREVAPRYLAVFEEVVRST